MGGTVYAIASGKGGVGKTTTAANLSATLRATGRAVALVDSDLTMSDLQDVIGLSHEPTLHDVLAGTASLTEACAERVMNENDAAAAAGGQLDVYPGAQHLTAYGDINLNRLSDAVSALADTYDTLVLDTGTGLSRNVALPLTLADRIIIVTTPTEVSTETADLLEIDPLELPPFFVARIQFDPRKPRTRIDSAASQSTATTNGDAATDDATKDTAEDVPNWFTMVK